ncbi:MAG TPA: YafY family protein [Candidatus Dormibacteraeota bacterium]
MLDTSTRLLRLLALLQSRREWQGAELASRLGVTTRTVRHDVARVRSLGYPVEAAPGVAGGYRLGAGGTLPPLLLEDDEAVAVAIGLRSAAGRGVAGMEESALRALVKLEQFLPARLRHRVTALQAYTVAAVRAGSEEEVDPQVLTRIAAACRDSEVLWIDYTKHDGAESSRSVEPHRLVHWGRRWYLVAWDRLRNGWRMFRVDRLRLGRGYGPRFVPRDPPAEDMVAFVRGGIRSAAGRVSARVVVEAPAETVAARVPPDVPIEALDERRCLAHLSASSYSTLAGYLGFMDLDFKVLAPPELVERLRLLSARFAAAAGTGS